MVFRDALREAVSAILIVGVTGLMLWIAYWKVVLDDGE